MIASFVLIVCLLVAVAAAISISLLPYAACVCTCGCRFEQHRIRMPDGRRACRAHGCWRCIERGHPS